MKTYPYEFDVPDRIEELDRREPHLAALVSGVLHACVPVEETETNVDLLDRLYELVELRALLEQTIRLEIQELRRWHDESWTSIASMLGVSRQSARERYQHPNDEAVANAEEVWDARLKALVAQRDLRAAEIRAELAGQNVSKEEIDAQVEEVSKESMAEAGALMYDHLDKLQELRRIAREQERGQ